MKWIARSRSEQNRAAIDPWTAVHFSAGLALGLMRAPALWAATAAIAYEVLEQAIERTEAGRELFETTGPESAVNAVTDLAVFAGGYQLGRRWSDVDSD